MVTPLTADDHVNERALRRLTQYLLAGGVHGLFAVGSQGEFWALSAEEKRRVWEIVVEEVNGRVPVYAGTAAVTTRECIALTQLADKSGADAVSVLTPFFVSPSEDELFDHYRAVAGCTNLPVVLYSNPARTGIRIAPQLLARLASVQNIVGIKDSSGDLDLTAEYLRVAPPSCSVLMGRDTQILAGLVCGAQGAIAATANVAPALVVAIYEHFQAGDLDGARQAQEQLAPLRRAFAWGTYPVVVKEALDLLGLEAGPARAPVGPLPAAKRAELRQVLVELGMVQ